MITLGSKVRDTISGFSGIATARSTFLHGCIRVGITPTALHDGKPVDTHWFDEPQVEIVEAMSRPAAMPSGGPRPNPTRSSNPSR